MMTTAQDAIRALNWLAGRSHDEVTEARHVATLRTYIERTAAPAEPKAERKRVEVWLNVYRDDPPGTSYKALYETKEKAEKGRGPNCIATVRLLEVGPDDHVIPGKAWEEAKAMVESYRNKIVWNDCNGGAAWDAFIAYSRAFNRLRKEIEP